jgi:hypothetical protein
MGTLKWSTCFLIRSGYDSTKGHDSIVLRDTETTEGIHVIFNKKAYANGENLKQ